MEGPGLEGRVAGSRASGGAGAARGSPGQPGASPAQRYRLVMDFGRIAPDDPTKDDVQRLVARHLAKARSYSPPEDVHALDVDGLVDPAITFFSFRRDGQLLGVAALKRLGPGHAELKSMHTAREHRRQGVGRAMVEHIIAAARDGGYRRLSLETGTTDAFIPARALYATLGFEPCGPFGDYVPSPNSTFMTLTLE